MEALFREINDILKSKNAKITLLEWENAKLRKEIAELKNDIEKYEENEENRHE